MSIRDGKGLIHLERGPFSSAMNTSAVGMEVRITKVDKFAEYIESPSIDLTIMDVEGHELNVLKGAAETIKTFKPSLALSAYYCGDDFVKLPKFLLELNPNYKFYLRHCSYSWIETVLYAT